MITLDQFIERGLSRIPATLNSDVKEPGFKRLYVRIGRRFIDGGIYEPVLDLANLEASRPGRGAFSNLITRLQSEYPNLILLVECVLNVRFVRKLEKMGFERIDNTSEGAPTLWLPPKDLP